MYVCIFINYKSKVSKILLFCATHNTIHVKDWIKNTFHRSLLATSTCDSFTSRLANTDDIDRPIYGLSAKHQYLSSIQFNQHGLNQICSESTINSHLPRDIQNDPNQLMICVRYYEPELQAQLIPTSYFQATLKQYLINSPFGGCQ